MDFTINVKKGMGELLFGMTVDDVKRILGEPADNDVIDNGFDEEALVFDYYDLGLTLFFEGETRLLSCIESYSDDTLLFGKKVSELNDKEIVQLMVVNNYFEEDIEAETWGEKRISFGEANIDFFFENDELVSILFGK